MDTLRREALLKEYSEVGSNFRLLTDIRFKLLAFLPIAAAAAAALKGDGHDIAGLGLSLFGLVATLGLTTYHARNDQLYNELIARAASIERSLGLPDGSFANRPRPWLEIPVYGFRWSIDHGTGISAIYGASIALWTYGVLAPILESARQAYLQLEIPRVEVTNPAIVTNMLAMGLAIALTISGAILIGKHKKRREKNLRQWAADAVRAASGLPILDLAQHKNLILLCANLAGVTPEIILARASFYSKLSTESLDQYFPSGSPEVVAAYTVALLTDLPARWLFDCATNRRGALDSKDEVRPTS